MTKAEAREAEAIGARLRARRASLGLSQRDLAERGVTYAYISRIEAGQRRPSVKALRKLAPKLEVTVEWLETGKEDRSVELARLVLASDGRPVSKRARTLARAIVGR